MKRLPNIPSRRKGFSLLEVAIAMAIFVFVLTSLLGMLSVGVGACRESIDIGAGTQMANAVINEINERPFLTLEDFLKNNSRFYFDDQGAMLLDSQRRPIQTPEAVYRAEVRLTDVPDPRGSAHPQLHSLKQMTIIITPANAAINTADVRIYSTLIFNNEGN